MDIIHKVAALVLQDRRLLVIRKGSDVFVSPGGKPEPGDINPEATLRRALRQELATDIAKLQPFRVFTEKATEGSSQVLMDSYIVQLASPPQVGPLIAELAWVDSASATPMALILKSHVLPALKEAGLVD